MTKFMKLDIQKFALITRENSVSSNSPASTQAKGTLYVKMVENSTNTANNTSNITITVSMTQTLGSYAQYAQPTLYLKWYDDNEHSSTTTFTSKQVSALSRNESATLTHTFDATHKADGTLNGYAIAYWYYEKTGYAPATCTVTTESKGTALTAIPRQATLTAAPDFNDEGNPTITYSNPAGSAVEALDTCISWTGADDITYRSLSTSGTSYTYNFTDAERKKLRQACATKDSMTVTFYVRTTLGGSHYYSTIKKTFSIVNATPTISAAYEETSTTAKNIIGSNAASYVIKGISQPKITLTTSVKKEATLSSTKISDGTTSSSASSYTFTNPNSGSFTYEMTDSRGKKASGTLTKTYISYFKPAISNSKFTFKSITDNSIVLNATATYYNASLGFQTSNPLTITVLNSAGTTVKTLTSSEYSVSGNNITISNLSIGQSGADKVGQSYTLRIADTFDKAESNNVLSAAVPTFEAGRDSLQVNGKLYIADTTRNNIKEIRDLIYPIGSIYMSVNSTSPASLFGGTWTQLKDRFLIGAGNSYAVNGTGGAATVAHTHTYAHTHGVPGVAHTHSVGAHSHGAGSLYAAICFGSSYLYNYYNTAYSFTPNARKSVSGTSNDYSTKQNEATGVYGTTANSTAFNSGSTTPGAATTNSQSASTTSGASDTNNMPPYLAVYMWKRTA